MNNENLSKLDVFLAMGETSDLPIYKKKFGSSIKNILVCGNMRLELLKKNILVYWKKSQLKLIKIWRLHSIFNRISSDKQNSTKIQN